MCRRNVILKTYSNAHGKPKDEIEEIIMDEEYNSLLKSKIWELVPCPQKNNVFK